MMIKEEAFNRIKQVFDDEPKDKVHLIAKFYVIEGIVKNAKKELKRDADSESAE